MGWYASGEVDVGRRLMVWSGRYGYVVEVDATIHGGRRRVIWGERSKEKAREGRSWGGTATIVGGVSVLEEDGCMFVEALCISRFERKLRSCGDPLGTEAGYWAEAGYSGMRWKGCFWRVASFGCWNADRGFYRLGEAERPLELSL
eukprot:7646891-Pyramimonas_sp.AAC.2